MERHEIRIERPWLPLKVVSVIVGVILLIIAISVLFVLTLVTTEVGYITLIIDPVAGTVTTKGDGTTARWFFFSKAPWAYEKKVYVAVDVLHMWTEGGKIGDFPAVGCLTKDGLAVEVDITVRWRINPSNVLDLFKKYPELDWKSRTIVPLIRETLRDVSSKYTAMETITKREEIAVAVNNLLEKALREEPTLQGSIVFEGIDLREINLPRKFTDAIEAKLSAEQEKLAAEFQAAKVLVLANADANATVIRAQGTAEAINQIAEKSNIETKEIAQLYILVEALKKIAETEGKVVVVIVQGEAGSWIMPIPP
ncbi:MAG: prohibitin family protein [Crenarchaeota archaeon]|nr:prohibitin family protein [Thermoproteota archaeon]MDW8033957.1 prohibitin family protein [Nitrososphaerota archaeon]